MIKRDRADLRARVVPAIDKAQQRADLLQGEAELTSPTNEGKTADRFRSVDSVAAGRAAGRP